MVKPNKTHEQVKKILKKHDLVWIDGEYIGGMQPIVCLNKDEDIVMVKIHRLDYRNPSPYSKSNPYAIQNFQHALDINGYDIRVLKVMYDRVTKIKCIDKFGYIIFTNIHSIRRLRSIVIFDYKSPYFIHNINLFLKNKKAKIRVENDYYRNKKGTILSCVCSNSICNNEWKTTWDSLKMGSGCPSCSGGHYSLKIANRNKELWKNIDSKVYMIECWSESEHFYKIGITRKEIIVRFRDSYSMPYNFKVLKIIDTNKYDATVIESYLHLKNKEFRYIPLLKFSGYTECFSELICMDVDLEYCGFIDEIKEVL